MQFLKLEGFIKDSKWSEENDNRRVLREKTRKIAMKSVSFNQKLNRKAFFFVADASEDTVSAGILCRESDALQKQIPAFLRAIEIDLMDTVLEEVTFDVIQSLLQHACRNNYIESNDAVLEQFNLDKLTNRLLSGLEFGENLIEDADKKTVYEEADKYLSREKFLVELDRIYAGNAPSKMYGHPVHYLVETDDREIRKGMYRLLLQALHANGRLRNKRYAFMDVKLGDSFFATGFDCLYQSCIGGAVVIRFIATEESESDQASSCREMIESLCEIMKKYRNQVLTVFCLHRECTKIKAIFEENLGTVTLIELAEEFVSGEQAEHFLKMIAKGNGVRVDKKLLSGLEVGKGYLAPDLRNIFDAWYNDKLKNSVYPQYKETAAIKEEVRKAAPKGSAYDELMDMVGLTEAKKMITQAINCYKAQKIFADKGMKADKPAMHMIFTGSPGTAKTSVARLFARIMKENNLVSKGTFVEAGRADLVGKFVGWTAPKIQSKFREAQGGILLIDEAYSLVDDRDGSYGDEAINTIVQEMENHRDEVVVIFAGYPDKMEGLLRKNPGLRSRIAFHVPFMDYSTEELCEIANLIAKKKGFKLTDGACQKLKDIFESAKTETDFGNGRYVRNVIEKAKMAQADRLVKMNFDAIQADDIATICAEDVEPPATLPKQVKRRIGFCA